MLFKICIKVYPIDWATLVINGVGYMSHIGILWLIS